MFGLSFLNPLLLLGALASFLPLLIHFLTKKEPATVYFSSLRFLQAAAQSVRRRWHIRNYLLLILRMLILLLLAFLFARPALTSVVTDSTRNLIIVIDNSPSMAYRIDEVSRFDKARQIARQIITSAGASSQISLSSLSSFERAEFQTPDSPKELLRKLEAMKLAKQGGNILNRLKVLFNQAAAEEIEISQAYFITDRQKNLFKGGSEKQQKFAAPINVLLAGGANYSNAAVLRLVSDSAVHYAGYPQSFDVELGYWSDNTGNMSNVLGVSINKEKILQRSVNLTKKPVDYRFVHTFNKAGRYQLEVELDDDNLSGDNRLTREIEVQKRPRVLLINSGEEDSWSQGAFYFKQALTTSYSNRKQLIELLVSSPEKLANHSLSDFDLIIYPDLVSMGRQVRIPIEDFCALGGGLLLTFSDEADLTALNGELYGSNRRFEGFLPARFDQRKKPQSPLKLLVESLDHPLFQKFTAAGDHLLSTASYYEYLTFKDEQSAGVEVLARYSDQAPALLEKKFGRGRIIIATSNWGGYSNNLAISPEFLPLVYQLTYYLADKTRAGTTAASVKEGYANFPELESDLTQITIEELRQQFPGLNWSFDSFTQPEVKNTNKALRREITLPLIIIILSLLLLEAFLTHRKENRYEHKNLGL